MTAAEIGKTFTRQQERFDRMAKAAFGHQHAASPIYGRFAGEHRWTDWTAAPFLPVEAFKWEGIVDPESTTPDIVFASSATGGRRSRHPVLDLSVYERSVTAHFADVFGVGPFQFLAHLPTYAASGEPSSLLHMVDILIRRFGAPESRFVAGTDEFSGAVHDFKAADGRLLVFGTAFGLLEMSQSGAPLLPPGSIMIETGGMKTYRREITRGELHSRLAEGFGLGREQVWSEYGMCELLSQCYTRGGEIFYPPPWMRFKIVDAEDPDREVEPGYPGLLAFFDLANIFSVSPVLTSDLGVKRSSGFEVLGRADAAEIRGCNFLLEHD